MSTSIKLKKYTEFPSELVDETQVPIFCTPRYANYLIQAKSQDVFWFAGFLNEMIICIIPFSIVKKAKLKKGTFLTAVVILSELNESFEKDFLELVVEHIREYKICDWIQQSPNWALFRIVPSKSTYCAFGTYRINLQNSESNEILKKMSGNHRRHIIHAINNTSLVIKKGTELLDDCIEVFSVSAAGKNVQLPTKVELEELLNYLPDKIHIYVSYDCAIPQSCVIYFSDSVCFYYLYAAMITSPAPGINLLLHWQAMLDAKSMGVKYYDFVGSRIHPAVGSKQESLKFFKSHFGGEFVQAYLWKIPISKIKYYLYSVLTRFISLIKVKKYKGDIIDQELKRIKQLNTYSPFRSIPSSR